MAVLVNDGAGALDLGSWTTWEVAGCTHAVGLTAADLDGDGSLDLVTACDSYVRVFFAPLTTVPPGSSQVQLSPNPAVTVDSYRWVSVADIDLDGTFDVLASGYDSNELFQVSLFVGARLGGSFESERRFGFSAGSHGAALLGVDLDDNRIPDVALSSWDKAFFQNGAGLTPWTRAVPVTGSAPDAGFAALGVLAEGAEDRFGDPITSIDIACHVDDPRVGWVRDPVFELRRAGLVDPGVGLRPLTAPVRCVGDVRAVTDLPTSDGAPRRRIEPRLGAPLSDSVIGATRAGLALDATPPRALLVELPALPTVPADDVTAAAAVRVFARYTELGRAADLDSDPLHGADSDDHYLAMTSDGAGGLREVIERHSTTDEIPAAASPATWPADEDEPSFAVVVTDGRVRIRVYTDRLGLYQAFIE